MNFLQLTKGAIARMVEGEGSPPSPILQILSLKKISDQQGSQDRFRLNISDGEYSHSFAMLASHLNKEVYADKIQQYCVIRADRIVRNTMNNKKILVITQLEVLQTGLGAKIGNPIPWGDSDGPAANPAQLVTYGSRAPEDVKPYPVGHSVLTGGTAGDKTRMDSYDHPRASKNPVMERSNIDPRSVAPIQDINLYNSGKITIRARVTQKGEIKNWTNARGEGKLFSMDLLDETGEIRMTGYNEAVDKFYDLIEVNQVYYVKNFTVKYAKKSFSSIRHDCEISFNNDTQLLRCADDTPEIPKASYSFVKIAEIEKVAADTMIDIIGICKSFGECQNVTTKSTRKEVKKRDLVIVDQSNKHITLTLWGKSAEDFTDDSQPVVVVKGVKVSDYNGKSLSCLSSSVVQINPDIQEAEALRYWYDNEGVKLTSESLSVVASGSNAVSWRLADEAYESATSETQKGDIFTCKVTLMAISSANAVYKACIADGCNKKVIDLGNGMFKCEKCNKEHLSFKWRVMLNCNFADFTGSFWATCFHETSEAILGVKAEVLGSLHDSGEDKYPEIFKKVIFQDYIGKFSSKMESYMNKTRTKVTVLELSPINHREYAKHLLNEIRESA